MINVASYKNKKLKNNIFDIVKLFENLLEVSVIDYFSDKKLFTNKHYSIYTYDELTLKTNVTEDTITTFYMEINQPNNHKVDIKKYSLPFFKKDDKLPNLFLKLEDIKKGIFENLINNLTEDFSLYLNKQSIFVEYNCVLDNNSTITYYFEIIPCITYVNKDNCSGVIYYTDDLKEINIDYPSTAVDNFLNKNIVTKNKLLETVIILKNILIKEYKYQQLPFKFIETFCYNVPDELYIGDFNTRIINIINYMRNLGLSHVTTIDEQDYIFASKYKPFSALYAKKLLKDISSFIVKNI